MSTLSLTLSRTFEEAQKFLIIYLKNESNQDEAFFNTFISIEDLQFPHFQDSRLLNPEFLGEKLTEEGEKHLHYINLAKLTFFICTQTEREIWLKDYFKLITGKKKLFREAIQLYVIMKLYLLRCESTPEDLAEGLVTKIKSDSIEDLIPKGAEPEKRKKALKYYSAFLSSLTPATQEQVGSLDEVSRALRSLVERRTRSWVLDEQPSVRVKEEDIINLISDEEVEEEVDEVMEEVYELELTDNESQEPSSLLSSPPAESSASPCTKIDSWTSNDLRELESGVGWFKRAAWKDILKYTYLGGRTPEQLRAKAWSEVQLRAKNGKCLGALRYVLTPRRRRILEETYPDALIEQ